MTENACQTSCPDDKTKDEELKQLRDENFILQGKIRGYNTLGDLLIEERKKCERLKRMNEELEKKIPNSMGGTCSPLTVAGTFSHDSNPEQNVVKSNPETRKKTDEGNPISASSDNIDVSLKRPTSGHSNGTIETHRTTNPNLNSCKTPPNWTDQMEGVSYPPNYTFQQIKTDKYPTQESLPSNNDPKTELTYAQKKNSLTNGKNSENRTVLRSSSTFVNVGSDSSGVKSLNLMEFPSTHSEDHSEKSSNMTNGKVVNSKSSSFQVIKSSLSRQDSNSERALSLHVQNVTDLIADDMGTHGTSSRFKKMLEDILPDLNRIEEENRKLKVENTRLAEENSRLLMKIQQLELQVNNVSMSESLSSQTQVVGWDFVSKADVQNSKNYAEKDQKQTQEQTRPDPILRLQQLEIQNRNLLQANARWEKMFKEMRSNQEKVAKQHQLQLDALREQISKRDLEDEKRRCEYDRILLSTKNRLEDEETAKEALQAQLTEYIQNYEHLQMEKRQLEESFSAINREHLVSEAEISVLRQGTSGHSLQHISSESDLRTEIAVLREQLTVFQEDFDRERSDRAKAQSEKDDLYKQLNKVRSENHRFMEQNKRYLAQLQIAEINVKEAIEESTRLNSANVELKGKIRQLENQIIPRPSLYAPNIPSSRPQPSVMVQPETDPYARPSPPYLFNHSVTSPGNQQSSNRERYPSEQQPGAWNCDDCTFSNHPSRVVCEMCGKIRLQDTSTNTAVQNPTSSPTLLRRGENGEQNDLSSDCGR